MRKLAMAASIYCVWQERNQIIYQQRIKSAMQVLKDVEANVMSQGIVLESENLVVCKSWGLDERNLL